MYESEIVEKAHGRRNAYGSGQPHVGEDELSSEATAMLVLEKRFARDPFLGVCEGVVGDEQVVFSPAQRDLLLVRTTRSS